MRHRSIILILCLLMAITAKAGDITYHFWKGKINDVEIKMACAEDNDILTGEIFQNLDGETVVCNVAGMKNGNFYDIKAYREIEGEGIVHTHFLRAEIKNGELIGITQNDGRKFRLKKYSDPYAYAIDQQPGFYSSPYIEGKTYSFHEWDHGGAYIYRNHMDVEGELELWYKPDQESFTLSIRRDSEANGGGNDALVGINGLHPDEETGDFIATTCEGSYRFSVTFHGHFLIIRQISGSPAKCFGSGASIVGIYIALPAKG